MLAYREVERLGRPGMTDEALYIISDVMREALAHVDRMGKYFTPGMRDMSELVMCVDDELVERHPEYEDASWPWLPREQA